MGLWARYKLKRQWTGGQRPRKKHPAGWIRAAMERSTVVRAFIAISACVGTVCAIVIGQVSPRETLDLYAGQPASSDVFADVGFSCENKEETQKLRQELSQKVPPHYILSPVKLMACAKQIKETLGIAAGDREKHAAPVEKVADAVNGKNLLTAQELEPLKSTSAPVRLASQMESFLREMGGAASPIIKDTEQDLQRPKASGDSERHKVALLGAADAVIEQRAGAIFPRDRRMRDAVAQVLKLACRRSMEYDEELTQAMRERVIARVKPVVIRVQPGSKIIEKGNEVTARQMDMYAAYLAAREQSQPLPVKMREHLYYVLGLTLLTVMFLIISRRYLFYYQEQAYQSNATLCMLEVIVLGSLLLSRGISLIPFGTIQSGWNNIFYYLAVVTVPMAAMLMTLLLNRTISLYFTICLGIFIGIMKGFSLPYTIVSTVSGVVAVYSTVGVRSRNQLIRAGASIALANLITIGALDSISGLNIISATVGFRVAGGLLSGMLSAFMAASLLPLFEHVFNVVTDIRWLELSDLNHPLLKRMFMEAPGTYHHSLMVGTLAESAAEVVGANPLQARVCAYFHDIGKLNKPEYFTENEPYGKSMHKELKPRMSNLIILAHVKDGVDIALTHKLNGTIVGAIREHHGTSLVYFFYRLAEETKLQDEEIAQEDFRYGGPKPQCKETAIILLADAAEAASRSLSRPTPSRVKNLVRGIVNQRIIDGQLEECDITFNDLRLIAERFEHILNSTFHARIKYPEREEGEHGEGLGEEPPQKVQA